MLTAGIDTAKDKLDVAIHGQPNTWTVPNSPLGWQQLAGELGQAGVKRIGIEATGGYERGVTRHLQAAAFIVVILQPLQVKAFARSASAAQGQERPHRRHPDRCLHEVALDAAQNKLPPDPRFDELTDHLTFIEQIEEDIARCKTRLEHISDKRLRRSVVADIARLERRCAAVQKRLIGALRTHADLARRFEPGAERPQHR